jgi:hypothetical protein
MTSSLKSSLNGSPGSYGEAVAEGARRATGETVSPEGSRRDPEVVAIAKRRQFSARPSPIHHLFARRSHWTRLGANRWPDDVRLFEPGFVGKACGKRGPDVRPDR